jgi:hypothetical protein
MGAKALNTNVADPDPHLKLVLTDKKKNNL